MNKYLARIVVVVIALCFDSFTSASASINDGEADIDATALDGGGIDATIDGAAVTNPGVATLEQATRALQALAAGKGEEAPVEPQSLFDVQLSDEPAVQVDAERLRTLLRELEPTSTRSASPRTKGGAGAEKDAGAGISLALWEARISLDRARLAFYDLPLAQRTALLLRTRQRRIDAGTPVESADDRERDSSSQRQSALSAAQRARTEAERAAATELARLLDVERAQAAVSQELFQRKSDIAEQREITIGWQQRALEARARPGPSADRTYEDLRRALRSARDALSTALGDLGGAPTTVPLSGPDPLSDLRVDVDTRPARAARARVDAEATRLEGEEAAIRGKRAAQLFDEIDLLNAERLALLASLSPAKREAVTGFTASGWDQATSEVRQLALILRYHEYVLGDWFATSRHPVRALENMPAGGAVRIFEWFLTLGVFLWWRRRSTALLRLFHHRVAKESRSALHRAKSPASRLLDFVIGVHRPVEWLAILFILRSFLPASTQQILEVRILAALTNWIFGAALVVDAIDAIAAQAVGKSRPVESETAELRLRSLRLIARVVVVFALILVLSAMLVGRGTIYQWVSSTCWLASIPVLMVMVRWWKETVFRRIRRVRKPNQVQRWVLAKSGGFWTGFVAAGVGGAQLFVAGAIRGTRNRIGRFVITRRALAYLFRRQLDRRVQLDAVAAISPDIFEALGPETPTGDWVAGEAEDVIERLASRIRDRRGGIIAIVGERGMGKTVTLRRLKADLTDAVLFQAPPPGRDALRDQLAVHVGLPKSATFEESAAAAEGAASLRALLIDDANRFVQPVISGLQTFDALMTAATAHAHKTVWVFAFDHAIWQFLERARGARPLFDEVIRLEPWAEERIVKLIGARTKSVGLSPSFESLLEPLPATADELDKQEALASRAADYYRLLWDAAVGNPGVALHMWRRSLGTDAHGMVTVRPSTPLDTSDLESLPDSSVFVLRAVLQLAPARVGHIATGTLIKANDVADALRYAMTRGYVEERDGGYQITWTWFRAITLFLQRRHLLLTR